VLPLKAASYKVLKSVQKDKPQYDCVNIIPKQDNTEAGKCSTAGRYQSWPMGHYIAVADARVLFPRWCDSSQLITFSDSRNPFHIQQIARRGIQGTAFSMDEKFLGSSV